MKALLDIGRTKLKIDLSPITLDPRIDDVRRFCSLLNDGRARRSHYSTLLYARVETAEPPKRKMRAQRDDLGATVLPCRDSRRIQPIRSTPRVRNHFRCQHETLPENNIFSLDRNPSFGVRSDISTRGSPGRETRVKYGYQPSAC